MRMLFMMILAGGLLSCLLSSARADEPNAAVKIIDTAIQAHGGLEALTKAQKMTRKATGTMSFFGQDVPFADELTLQLPERSRWTLEGGPEGQKVRFIVVCRGDKAWQSTQGKTTEATKDRLEEIQDEIYVLWIANLASLKTEKGFSFFTLPDSKVDGRDAYSVLVSRQGRGDLRLSFDKASGLLVRIERKAKQAGVPVDKEYLYTDYRTVGGVKLPCKYLEQANGKKVVDVGTMNYEFLSRIDDSVFEKP
jgi:hypothetical protein